MENVQVKFKNGKSFDVEVGTTYHEICCLFDETKKALAVKINNEIVSLTEKITKDEVIEIVDLQSLDGKLIYKSGLKFIFQAALHELYPEADIIYDHSVPFGMLGEIEYSKSITHEELINIKNKMHEIVNKDLPIKKMTIHKKEAIKFFNTQKQFEKADNVSNINDLVITLYELDGVYNYFYSDMPYSTKIIDEFDLVYIGNNRIIFLMPSAKFGYKIPEYVHYDNIIKTFDESKSWLQTKKVSYLNNLNLKVSNGKIKDFMKSNEIVFYLSIMRIVENIMNNKSIKFIMVAGPSSSGKTTTTDRLSIFLDAIGYNTVRMSTDDYFVDRDDSPRDENGNVDFECLEAVDLDYMNSDLKKLIDGEVVTMPKFNFISGKKEPSNNRIKLEENTIVLIEGLHTLNDELTPVIDPKLKYKIYLSPFMALSIDKHNYVSSIDVRLLRRIVRDNRTRGYGVATTIHNWQSVRSGEEKYIFPYIHQADVILNTSLAFEINVLKIYVEPLLRSVGIDSQYHAEAQRLLYFLKQFYPVPGEYVNKESILREFIGGN